MTSPLSCVLASAVVALAAQAASAQLIRPDSATATSEFSGSYDIGNAIDGSGLPANFTLTDAHATYTTNNHWTTQANHTIGESATFTFNTAKTLGAFHMWNHRSNGVAANPNYEPTLFDLTFYDGANGAGAVLATLTNITAAPNVATAQTFPFQVVSNVRSVKFTVRATENGNVSPYTGLAEVAFGPCVPVEVRTAGQPHAAAVCPMEDASFVVMPYGSGAFGYQWQWRTSDAAPWVNVTEGANAGSGNNFNAVGSHLPGLVVFPTAAWSTATQVSFRAVVTNPCGEAPSRAVRLVVDPADVGRQGGVAIPDGVHDNNDFVVFISHFFTANPAADLGSQGGVFGPDGTFDNNDFVSFINEFFTSCG